MPGETGEPRGDDTRVVLFFPTRGCGCIEHPAFPTPLFSQGQQFMHHSGKSRRGNVEACVLRCLKLNQLLVVPDQRAKASADPGSITTGVRDWAKAVEQRVSKQAI